MPAQLLALDVGPSILLDKPILLLGRHPECDIQIDSRKISRRHCCIAQVCDYLVVRDLGSTNGIRINGVRINEGRLSVGDELTIGNNRYKIVFDANDLAVPQDVPQKPSAKPVYPVGPIPDAMLESCDDPIPLEDPIPRQPEIVSDRRSPSPASASKDASLILPEKLELLPNSGLFSRNNPHPSASGSHPPA